VFLSADDQAAIVATFPDLLELSTAELGENPTVQSLAEHFNLAAEAIIAVVVRARAGRG